jgi:hypothetical protein
MFHTDYIAETACRQMRLLDVTIHVNAEVNTLLLPLPCILWPQFHGRPSLLSSRPAWPWDRLAVLFVRAYKCHEDIRYGFST